jgi:hypothetical protein
MAERFQRVRYGRPLNMHGLIAAAVPYPTDREYPMRHAEAYKATSASARYERAE